MADHRQRERGARGSELPGGNGGSRISGVSGGAAFGTDLLARLGSLLRTVRTHGVGNQAFTRQVGEFLAVIGSRSAEAGDFTLSVVADCLYLDGKRVTVPPHLLPIQAGLIGHFSRHNLSGMRIRPAVTAEAMARFLTLLIQERAGSEDRPWEQVLLDAGVDTIEVIGLHRASSDDPAEVSEEAVPFEAATPVTETQRARRTYATAVRRTRRLLLRASRGGYVDIRSAQRIVHPMVDLMMVHESSIVGLTALKAHDDYTFAHCVNVAILSVGIGQTLGLNRGELADVGVAGLLHDVGKIHVPGEILRKPGKLTEEEWRAMQGHPLAGACMISRMPGVSRLMLDSMRVSLEHHLNSDGSGYPPVGEGRSRG